MVISFMEPALINNEVHNLNKTHCLKKFMDPTQIYKIFLPQH